MKDSYLEIEYEIVKSRRKTAAIEVRPDGSVIVRLPQYGTKRQARELVEEKLDWIRKTRKKAEIRASEAGSVKKLTEDEMRGLAEEAKRVIPGRVRYYADRIGVGYGRITIRNQRTRWGSCSSKGNLNFNCLLMLTPLEVIDSVIVHELCHRKEMNHSKAFYVEVLKAYPEYWKWNRWLKENGPRLMSMSHS